MPLSHPWPSGKVLRGARGKRLAAAGHAYFLVNMDPVYGCSYFPFAAQVEHGPLQGHLVHLLTKTSHLKGELSLESNPHKDPLIVGGGGG